MGLSDTLTAILRNYRQSVVLLEGYLQHIGEAIKKVHEHNETIVKKFEAAKAGAPDPSPVNADEKTVRLELKPEDMDFLIDVMRSAKSSSSQYPDVTYRMSFVYLVALFDAFLSDVFSQVARARPNLLKSSKKQVSYDKLLEFGSFEALIEFIASRELNELSYKSMKDQADYYRDRFGVALDDSGVPVSELIELRSTRNLLVHNNGVVNQIYLELVPNSTYRAGDYVKLDASYFDQAVRSLKEVAAFITEKLIEKHANKPSAAAQMPAS